MPVTKESEAIRRMFARISPRYDFLNHLLSLNIDRRWRRRAADELALRPGDRVLDACTGTGDLAFEIARRLDPSAGGSVVGSDFCAEMVAIAEEKRRKRREERASFIVADTLALPFPDGAFDAACVAFGIRNVADLRGGLAELGRVLRPGGRLAILEFCTPERVWFRRIFGLYFRRILPWIGRWFSGDKSESDAYAYLPASVAEFPDARGLSRLLAEIGFTAVRFRHLSLGIAAVHVAERAVSAPRGGRESQPCCPTAV